MSIPVSLSTINLYKSTVNDDQFLKIDDGKPYPCWLTARRLKGDRRPSPEARSAESSKRKDKGGNLYHVSSFVVNRITRWQKWMRPETQKQQTDANSRIKTSAAERVLKISEIYAKATEF